jgi:hypothetical protein
MLRSHRLAFRLTSLAAIPTTACLVEWTLIVAPMNTRLNGWTPPTLPLDWTVCREQGNLATPFTPHCSVSRSAPYSARCL